MTLHRVTAQDVVASFPSVCELSGLDWDRVGLLLLAAGYEDRALGVISALLARGVEIEHCIALKYDSHRRENLPNEQALLKLCAERSIPVQVIDLDTLSTSMIRALEVRSRKVVVDLSSMSGKFLLRALSSVFSLREWHCAVTYAEAEVYYPTEADFRAQYSSISESGSFGLESGVSQVTVEADFGYGVDPHLRDRVVVFAGFSRDRVRAALNSVNPALLLGPEDRVLLVIGEPRLPADSWRKEAMSNLHRRFTEFPEKPCPTFDYREALLLLLREKCDSELSSNLTVAFFGSKLQGLAVGLFSAAFPSVRVVTASPIAYRPEEYTRGVRQLYLVPLGDVAGVVGVVASMGTLVGGNSAHT